MNARTAFALAAVLGAALLARPAAAQTTDTTAATPAAPAHRVRHDRNLLTPEDFAGRHEDNAYALVRTLRPSWLRGSRGVTSNAEGTPVVVYRDGVRMGGENELRSIATVTIREIRYLDAMAATQQFGTDHGGGAILVATH
ncbi:hypothetical protein [Longimicrobium sp.]|uniref:hypothetical protein n=1 Tax=Longimicrobium sp. TaxID=2029185 RepID=UPI002C33161B|nr:hypothetical protein [Longimicrobium sp.]HSU17409.1 hypothetical protein [Longimicrobium sp.]